MKSRNLSAPPCPARVVLVAAAGVGVGCGGVRSKLRRCISYNFPCRDGYPMATIMPPPEYCDEVARRQAVSVAVRNNALPSTTYLPCISREHRAKGGYLHDRYFTGKVVPIIPF